MMGWNDRFGWGALHGSNLTMMVIMFLLIVVPFWRLLPKGGIPNWVAIFSVFPIVAVGLLWIVAFKGDFISKGANDGRE